MTNKIRVHNGGYSLFDCEVTQKDLRCATSIQIFADLLFSISEKERQAEFIKDVDDIDQIRRDWWEEAEDSGRYASIQEFVAEKFKAFVEKWQRLNLVYSTD